MTPQSRFSDFDRALQSKHLVKWPHKVLAAEAGLTRQSVTALAMGQWPVSLFRAFQFAMIQNDYTLVQLVAAGAQAAVLPYLPPLDARTQLHLLTEFVIRLGEFMPLADKVRSDTHMTRREKIKLRVAGEKIKQVVEAIIQQAELQEDEDVDGDDGHVQIQKQKH